MMMGTTETTGREKCRQFSRADELRSSMIQNMAMDHPVDVQNVDSPELKHSIFFISKSQLLVAHELFLRI